jgi:hypothetical protein
MFSVWGVQLASPNLPEVASPSLTMTWQNPEVRYRRFTMRFGVHSEFIEPL